MNPTKFQERRHWDQEFERRTKAMPFTRFVKHGEPLPTEIGNVDKLKDFEGEGTWYMFPTAENLQKSYGGIPEDPTLGQEAQGGPVHGITGRGEKYADGNVETEMVADEFKDPQAEGHGSQTGGTGIQRAQVGDGAAIGSAIEDPDVNNAPNQHPSQGDAKEAGQPGTGGPSGDEAGQTGENDADDGNDGKSDEDVKQEAIDGASNRRSGGVSITVGGGADTMKQGEKTAGDDSSLDAATASHSDGDLEDSAPGVEATDTGEVKPDQGEGTAADTANPWAGTELEDLPMGTFDDSKWTKDKLKTYLGEGGYKSSDSRDDLIKLAVEKHSTAGQGLAIQKSDEAAPTTGGGTMAPIDGVNDDEMRPDVAE